MNDPTRFDLDERQRAMLAEMGVRVWWPQASQAEAAPNALPNASPNASPPAPAPSVAPSAAGISAAAPAATPIASARVARPAAPVAGSLAPAPVASAQPLPEGIAQMDWEQLQASVAQCRACGLCEGRKNTVFGVGDRSARWMVIGEAPGENEDLQGEPFVGQAGKLLDNMLAAIGLSRQAEGATLHEGRAGVYIANTLKCRPPGNRNPEPNELQTCTPYLMRQLDLVQPGMVLAMGRFAVQSLLGTSEPIGKLRGRVHQVQGVPVVVTYHPAYLLRNPADKAKAWADLCLALQHAPQP